MKRVFMFMIILLSLVGCSRTSGPEHISATVTPNHEVNDKNVIPTQKVTLEQDIPKETYLDKIVNNVTPYSIFDIGADVAEGDVVIMGSYAHEHKEYGGYPYCPIQWLVLERQGEKALLLSLYNVDVQAYFKQGYMEGEALPESVSWEDSTLRNWLNESFMLSAFFKTERDCIMKVETRTQGNTLQRTNGTGDTQDFLFLLSEEEVNRYLDTEDKRITYTVPKDEPEYGLLELESSKDYYGSWWLRTSGYNKKNAAYVRRTGEVSSEGSYVESLHAVRPAMWVDLEKTRQVSETLSIIYKLNQEESLNKTEEEYRWILNDLWEKQEGEKSTAPIKAVEISLETIVENGMYDNSTMTLPALEECVNEIREIGKQWSFCEGKNFTQQRVSTALFKYGGEVSTEFIEYEQYWEIPEIKNQYIPRSF